MGQFILPVTSMVVCFGVMALMYRMKRKKPKHLDIANEKEEKLKATQSAQDFVNVKDIKETILHTQDGYIFSYVKIQPISLDLLTKFEKENLTRKLTDEFSQMNCPFKFLAVSQPVDIGPIVNEYYDILSNTDDQIQKRLLRSAIQTVSEFSLSGEVMQREFYYMIWERKNESEDEEELKKRTKELAEHIENAGFKAEVLNKKEIIKLCNLVDNPTFAAVEDFNTEPVIPFIQEDMI